MKRERKPVVVTETGMPGKSRTRRRIMETTARQGFLVRALTFGHRGLCPMLLIGLVACGWLPWMVAEVRASGVCAEVRLEIKQELTLERQAFEAQMTIYNGLDPFSLSNVNIEVIFLNATGGTVSATSNPSDTNALFFIRLDRMENIQSLSDGTVLPGQTADIQWLIIPAPGAGGESGSGELYYIGARLQYRLQGQAGEVEVHPDRITVRPMPRLSLDCFLPDQVYGDDPWTPVTEPRIPFSLGLRVSNSGAGPARNLRIESAEPVITENQQGLLVDFDLRGCEVHGRMSTRSLTADFGELPAGEAKVARWDMTASLMGRFTQFTATFTHADELGGELTSLIEGVATHTLIRDVLVDLPDRDVIRDFLAGTNGLTVYESDGRNTSVDDVSEQTDLTMQTGEGLTSCLLQAPFMTGPLYAQKVAPGLAGLNVESAVRLSDGKPISSANVWISKTRERGTDPWVYQLHLFDVDIGGSYVVKLDEMPETGNRAPTLNPLPPMIIPVETPIHVYVEAGDLDDDLLMLAAHGLPPGAAFTDHGDGTGEFTWTPTLAQDGPHAVRIIASDGQDMAEAWLHIRVDPREGLILVSSDQIHVREGGEGRFFVRLSEMPPGNVRVTVSRVDGDTNLWVKSGAARTFTPSNWSAWQAVTLAAGEDENAENESATFRVSVPGLADCFVTAAALDDDIGENLALASRGVQLDWTRASRATNLNDGVHLSSANYGYTVWSNDPPGSVTMDLRDILSVDRIRLLNWDWSYRVHQYRIESSLDGDAWVTVADASEGEHSGWNDWAVDGQPMRYLRFTGLSNSANHAVCIAEWEVYGSLLVQEGGGGDPRTLDSPTMEMEGREVRDADAAQEAESVPVLVLTSDGLEDTTGWWAVDGDPDTAWVGKRPGGGYIVVEYAPTLTLNTLEVDLVRDSLIGMDYLHSLDAEEWSPLPEDMGTHPVSLNYLWVLFPDDGSDNVPMVIDIRTNP